MANVVKVASFSHAKLRPKWVDFFLWVGALVVLVGGFVADYYGSTWSVYVKSAIWLGAFIIILVCLGLTKKGAAFLKFAKEARLELRKVHWPARQETLQTTLMVVAMVVVVGLFLWGVDSFFMWGINKLT